MSVHFKATSDVNAVLRDYDKLQAKNTQLTEKLAKLAAGAAGVEGGFTKSFRGLKRFADQTAASLDSPLEKYRAQAAQLDAAVQGNLLSQQKASLAIDKVAESLASAAGPVERYQIELDRLDRKLAAGAINQLEHARAVERAKQTTLAAAGPVERYRTEVAALDRELAAGKIGQDEYTRTVARTRQTLVAAADPVDALQLKLAHLDDQLDRGAISSQAHAAEVAKLQTASAGTGSQVEQYRVKLAALERDLQRGVVTEASHRRELEQVQREFRESASAADVYEVRMGELERQLAAGKISHDAYGLAVSSTRQTLRSATDPVDALHIMLARLDDQLEHGSISARNYASEVAKLQAAAAGTGSRVDQYRTRLAALERDLQRGVRSEAEHRREVQKLQQTFPAASAAADQYERQVRELSQQLDEGKIDQAEYASEVRRARDATSDAAVAAGKHGDAGGKLGGVLQGNISKLAGLAAGYVSVTATLQEFLRFRQQELELDQQAAQTQLTVADAQALAVTNLGAVETPEAQKFVSDIQGLSEQVKFESSAPLFQAAADVLSATGSNQELTKTILGQTAQLLKSQPEGLAEFSGAVADIAGVTGAATDAEIKKTIGLVLGVQSQARITSLDAFKEAAAAIAAATTVDTGEDRDRAVKEAGAAFAAVGGAIKDPTGAMTKTAVAELATQLEELLPEFDKIGVGGEVLRKGTGLKTLAERLAAVQGDEELQRLFMQGDTSQGVQAASFRGAVKPVIQQLVSNRDSEAARRFSEALTTIQADPQNFDQIVQNLKAASPQTILADFDRSVKGVLEGSQLVDQGAVRDRIRNAMTETLKATRSDSFVQGFADFVNEKGASFALSTETTDLQKFLTEAQGQLFNRRGFLLGRSDVEQARVQGGLGDTAQAAEVGRRLGTLGGERDRQQVQALAAEDQQRVATIDKALAQLVTLQRDLQQAGVLKADKLAEEQLAVQKEMLAEQKKANQRAGEPTTRVGAGAAAARTLQDQRLAR